MRPRYFITSLIITVLIGFIAGLGYARVGTSPNSPTQTIKDLPDEQTVSEYLDMTHTSKVEIDIKDFAFTPKSLRIRKGTTITWTNRDVVAHNAYSDDSIGPKTRLLNQNESASYTFNTAGKIKYYCQPHPSMQASIEVVD